ncbi:hypothetical protein EIP86_005716 [Pleurotus ostreatoroseus]|nr:hypothetical protein EIP86_005716 [Pleurotus ostreatoroseus]
MAQPISVHLFIEFPNIRTPGGNPAVIVPQRKYTSPQIFEPHPPIRFYDNGYSGISLSKAYVENFTGMPDAGTYPTLLASNTTRVATRIEWPGYLPWSQNMNVVDRSRAANPITKGKLANNIARALYAFFQEHRTVEPDGTARGWEVVNIPFDRLFLLELQHVSVGSWQPVFYYMPPQ